MKKTFVFFSIFLLITCFASAHTINYVLDKESDSDLFVTYVKLGFTHIIPLGFDHILFILCVFFLNTDIKKIILQASVFTIAHSITLALAVYGVIHPPTNLVEPLIAISIACLAIENIVSQKIKPWRIIMIFLFGLVHGMGFAGALQDLGLPQYALATSLVSFNLGVEIGQLCIIIGMYLLLKNIAATKMWYRKAIVIPANIVIGIIAFYWTIERILSTT